MDGLRRETALRAWLGKPARITALLGSNWRLPELGDIHRVALRITAALKVPAMIAVATSVTCWLVDRA